jgi:hypothetical protein
MNLKLILIRCREDMKDDVDNSYKLKLASADKNGIIFIWNVVDATVLGLLQGIIRFDQKYNWSRFANDQTCDGSSLVSS